MNTLEYLRISQSLSLRTRNILSYIESSYSEIELYDHKIMMLLTEDISDKDRKLIADFIFTINE